MIYFVVDTATQGVDFLLWGREVEAAAVTLAEMQDLGFEVEVLAFACLADVPRRLRDRL